MACKTSLNDIHQSLNMVNFVRFHSRFGHYLVYSIQSSYPNPDFDNMLQLCNDKSSDSRDIHLKNIYLKKQKVCVHLRTVTPWLAKAA